MTNDGAPTPDRTTADLLAALELLLPFAPTAPAWAIQAARDAIERARGAK